MYKKMSLVPIDKLKGKKISHVLNSSLAYVIHIILGFILEKAYWVILHVFFKINFFPKNSFRNTIRVSNSLDPDQGY